MISINKFNFIIKKIIINDTISMKVRIYYRIYALRYIKIEHEFSMNDFNIKDIKIIINNIINELDKKWR